MIKLPPLAQIAKEAGDTIAAMQEAIAADYLDPNSKQTKWHQKEDGSIVTDADIRANEIVCAGLNRHFPGVAIVSEENPEADNMAALKEKNRFETDPLDNTGGYVKNKDGYSVNIGRIENGVPAEGVIYFPRKKEMYYTQDGKAYLQQGEQPPKEIRVSRLPLRQPLKVAVGFSEKHVDYLKARPLELRQLPAQLRTCAVACGDCDITGINKGVGGFNTWDIAGPHAVLRAAGGEIATEDGKPFRYNGESIKVPNHIVGGEDALSLCLPDFKAERQGKRI